MSWLIISCVVIAMLFTPKLAQAQTIDCRNPPQLVDPALCCRDGGRDQTAEKCAQQVGLGGQPNGGPPSVEAATCLAECILTDSHYIQEKQKLNLATIRSDLTSKFSNDSAYVEAMTAAFAKCEPQTQQRLTAMQQYPAQPQSKCSPFAAMVLGCTYMEYFKNCPAHRWTANAACTLAKTFVTQCAVA